MRDSIPTSRAILLPEADIRMPLLPPMKWLLMTLVPKWLPASTIPSAIDTASARRSGSPRRFPE